MFHPMVIVSTLGDDVSTPANDVSVLVDNVSTSAMTFLPMLMTFLSLPVTMMHVQSTMTFLHIVSMLKPSLMVFHSVIYIIFLLCDAMSTFSEDLYPSSD